MSLQSALPHTLRVSALAFWVCVFGCMVTVWNGYEAYRALHVRGQAAVATVVRVARVASSECGRPPNSRGGGFAIPGTAAIDADYRYSVDGTAFKGCRVWVSGNNSSPDKVNQMLAYIRANSAELPIVYSIDQPSFAVMVRPSVVELFTHTTLLLGVGAALTGAAWAVARLMASKYKEIL